MALRMRHWVMLVLAACALVALRLLPPSGLDFFRPAEPAEVTYERALFRDAQLTNARLQRIRIAGTAISATLAGEGPLAFGAPDNVDPVELERVRGEALAEARAASEGGAGVALGLYYVIASVGGYPGAPRTSWFNHEYYFGEQGGRAYCVTLVPVWMMSRDRRPRLEWMGDMTSRLGVCQIVARFGLPGETARRWLQSGGAGMGITLVPSREAPGAFSTRMGPSFERRGALGIAIPGAFLFHQLPEEACMAGVEAGCAELLLDPLTRYTQSFVYSGRTAPGLFGTTPLSAVSEETLFYPADAHVVADLVDEFGEARFRRWWTGSGSADAAFRDAFGVEAGAWYAARVARLVTITPPGPGVSRHGFVGVFLFLALGGLAGSAWAQRRRVA